jgi:hypothetical protein
MIGHRPTDDAAAEKWRSSQIAAMPLAMVVGRFFVTTAMMVATVDIADLLRFLGSLLTRRWRKADSNRWSHLRQRC